MSDPLVQSIWDILVFRYTIVATFCFVMYEYLLNFDYELRFLWMRRFTFGSCLLFLCRYLPIAQINLALVGDASTPHCISLNKGSSVLVYLQYTLSSIVLYARTYAVWAGNKRVLAILLGTYSLSVVGTAYTVYRFIRGISVLDIRPWTGCVIVVSDHTIFYALIASVLMDLLGLCLLLHKSVLHTKDMKKIGFQQASLLTVMAQDGMAYFVLNIICTVANTIVLERASADYRDFLVTTQCCIQNVLCARLFFHMQTARKMGTGLTTASKMHSDIHFEDYEMKPRDRARTNYSGLRAEDATWTGLAISHSDDLEM
ncbi:hypothetical protein SCHPADRAFT_727422 [Schizopora paradoxa]|uniref:DUF6533 domain-containing protein n=1 Tax=Schizopora paradoxa TaxID=27342 RepID=A0A0H2R7J3_9AGAM|nr:hypothetical protein SCHPADRAFT_727422 [Schizopora paradoxa]